MSNDLSLEAVFDGWDGFQTSLVKAIEPLTSEQLAWRPAENFQSVGELARHISLGRLSWFMRMDAPGSQQLAAKITEWETDPDGNKHIVESAIDIAGDSGALVASLNETWQMIERTLEALTVTELATTYRHKWRGQTWAVSYQWTIWRILNHDVHHGGQLALMLGMQGIEPFELSGLFGHITELPLAD